MESPIWHAIGVAGVFFFALAILLTLLARRWFQSTDSTIAKRGAMILSALGGPLTARSVDAELTRRNVV